VAIPGLRRGAGLVLLGVALLACTACIAGFPGFASKKVYREGASTITGRADEFVIIELPADPPTGYSWSLVGHADPRVVTLIETDFAPPATSAAGPTGHQRWTFRLVGPGTTTITFGYGRTWANTPAEKATMFNVVVK
jgi:predicted secreted protein